jgi:hypothetical protein
VARLDRDLVDPTACFQRGKVSMNAPARRFVRSGSLFRFDDQTKADLFVWSLAATTVLFYFLTPIVRLAWWPFHSLTAVYTWLAFLTAAHVTLTQFIYFDNSSYRVLSRHRLRFFVVVPLFYAVVFMLMLSNQPVVLWVFFMYFGWWSYWHYQKQHYGVYTFINIYCGRRVAPIEKFIILAATAPAMLAIVPVIQDGHPLAATGFIARHASMFSAAGEAVLAVVLVCGVVVATRAFIASRGGPVRQRLLPALFLVFLASNYWPFFVFDLPVAAVMVTGGHGLQYCVFMAVYAFNGDAGASVESPSDERWTRFGGLVPVAMMFLFGVAIWSIATTWLPAQSIFGYTDITTHGALGSLGLSITGVHYIQDGVLWRLSDRHSRELAFEKYRFLFKPRPATTRAVASTGGERDVAPAGS